MDYTFILFVMAVFIGCATVFKGFVVNDNKISMHGAFALIGIILIGVCEQSFSTLHEGGYWFFYLVAFLFSLISYLLIVEDKISILGTLYFLVGLFILGSFVGFNLESSYREFKMTEDSVREYASTLDNLFPEEVVHETTSYLKENFPDRNYIVEDFYLKKIENIKDIDEDKKLIVYEDGYVEAFNIIELDSGFEEPYYLSFNIKRKKDIVEKHFSTADYLRFSFILN